MAKTKRNRNIDMDSEGHDMDIRSIMKDIQSLGSSHMTWKEKKELENRKVVALGGKPPKKQKLPLTVARFVMKKQKQREQKVLEENLILGRFSGKHRNGGEGSANKRRPEDRVLKSSEGNFRKGVLDVKHMLRPAPSGEEDSRSHKGDGKGVKKKGGGKKHGKRKGGSGKKRH